MHRLAKLLSKKDSFGAASPRPEEAEQDVNRRETSGSSSTSGRKADKKPVRPACCAPGLSAGA